MPRTALHPEICQRFKYFIKKYIGTQLMSAKEIGTSTRHISEVCNDMTDVSVNDMVQLMKKYKLNPEWLITGKGKEVK